VLGGVDSLSGIMRCTVNSIKFMFIFIIQEMIPCFVNHDLYIIVFIYVINNNSEITSFVLILIAVFLPFLHSFNYLLKQFLNVLVRLVASVCRLDVLGLLSSLEKANKFSLRKLLRN